MALVLSSVHILACVVLIILVLLQQGKGADIGSTLGGDSSSLFGPMTENPLKNVTTVVAIIFMGTSVVQAYRARYDEGAEGKLFSGAKNQAPVEQAPLNATEDPPAAGKIATDKAGTSTSSTQADVAVGTNSSVNQSVEPDKSSSKPAE